MSLSPDSNIVAIRPETTRDLLAKVAVARAYELTCPSTDYKQASDDHFAARYALMMHVKTALDLTPGELRQLCEVMS